MPAGSNIVVDISHYNGPNINFSDVVESGIFGVIHKATQGASGSDSEYAANKIKAQAAGLLWGAYHFGTGGDGVEQAEHFLNVVGQKQDTLLILDFEQNPTGSSMDLEEARAFITHIKQITGIFPGFYSGSYIKQLLETRSDPVLSQCWFWLAQYGRTAVVPANWPTWTMWQYTDGSIGPAPHDVPGIGKCDRDTFNGSPEQLTTLWRTNAC